MPILGSTETSSAVLAELIRVRAGSIGALCGTGSGSLDCELVGDSSDHPIKIQFLASIGCSKGDA